MGLSRVSKDLIFKKIGKPQFASKDSKKKKKKNDRNRKS